MAAMFSKILPLLAALGAIGFSASASAPAGAAPAGPADPAAVERYVQKVAYGPRTESVSRWRDPICPLVSGLSREQAELVLQRLSEIAIEVGAPLGPEDCHPNLYIVATKDPKGLIREWATRHDGLFVTARTADIDRLINSDRPVRVWRSVVSAGSDGHMMTSTSQALFGIPTQASKPVLNWSKDSRISGNTARYIAGAAVVLDPDISTVKLGQLADYIAMTSFAEVNPDPDLDGESSILSLFHKGASAPQSLSALDLAYLKALYAVQPYLLQQRVMIAHHMSGGAQP
jgi:hypothetical protein